MSLTPGTRIGVFQLIDLIGRGGMGEVYRATDTKLKRQVAIKILPPDLVADRDRLARFQREAEVLASLNHPNIAAIYGLEESGGMTALVMELVEGDDLSQRIARGAIPLDEALPIAKQIAEALEAAHEQGIIHRDLKSANIKVRADGTVKVLDFGLAKAMEPTGAMSPGMSQAPTITTPAMTQAGMILGTAAYMSPEQARGKTVDKRADIWAFGAVLYEMLTGTRAFRGDDVQDTFVAIMRDEPDWSRLPAALPLTLGIYLRRCLHKDQKQRIHDIADVRLALEGAFETAAPQTTGAATQAASASTSKLPWAVAAAVTIIAVLTSWVAWRATRPIEQALRPLVRLDVDLGSDVSLGSAAGTDAIISPDGTRLVYVSRGRLFTRRLDQPTATELAETQGAFAPFFSPDGQWVAFFLSGKLKKMSVEGGAVVTLCDAPNPYGGSWGEDGNIIAALGATDGGVLSRISSAGGAPTPVTELAQGELTHRWPQILPGGKAVLFTSNTRTTAFDGANIEVVSLADRRRKALARGSTFGRYLPASNGAGHLVYINKGTLFAVSFDSDDLELRGTPSPVLEEVAYSRRNGSAQFDFSRNGQLVYGMSRGSGLFTVAWIDKAGDVRPLLIKPGNYERPTLSPDGQRLALEIPGASGNDLWVYEWQRDTMTRLTFTEAALDPVWSPDGRYIAFQAVGVGMSVVRSDGAAKPQPLTRSKNSPFPWSFAPDGKRLAFYEIGSGTYQLWTVPLESDGAGLRAGSPEVFLPATTNAMYPSFSPDGRWLAYASSESGTMEVYVRAFPDKAGKWQISNSGGRYPMWARSGRELFFQTPGGQIMAAAYTLNGDSFVAEKPRPWFEKMITETGAGTRTFDLAPDGTRMAVVMPVETAEGQKAQSHVIFLENFSDDLRRKMPVDR